MSWIEDQMKKQQGVVEPPHAPYRFQNGEYPSGVPAQYTDVCRDYSVNDAHFTSPGAIPASAISPIFPNTIWLQGLTPGSVVFIGTGGKLVQDNANFFFDDTLLGLKLGSGVFIRQGTLHPIFPGTVEELISSSDTFNGPLRGVMNNLSTGTLALTSWSSYSSEGTDSSTGITNPSYAPSLLDLGEAFWVLGPAPSVGSGTPASGDYTSGGGTFIVEGWGKGGSGTIWTGSNGPGGGGGAYARAKVVTVNGDILHVEITTHAKCRLNGAANPFIDAVPGNSGVIPNAGLASACTGDVAYSGGNGANLGGSIDGGGGGAGASRASNGGSASGINGASSADSSGGNGAVAFSALAASNGGAPGGGGGGTGFGGVATPGGGGNPACAIWKLSDWNGDPTVAGTAPNAGATPVFTTGAYQKAGPVRNMYILNMLSGYLRFGTTGAERMRLLSQGALCINATAQIASEQVRVNGDIFTDTKYLFRAGTNFTGTLTHAITAVRTWTFPDITGTVMLTSGSFPFTPGSVIFADAAGLLAQNNASFFWDSVNLALTVGAARAFTLGGAPPRNFFFGEGAGNFTSTGTENTGIGYLCGASLTGGVSPAGSFNSFFGSFAGQLVTTGYKLALFGRACGDNISTGNQDSCFGYGSGHNLTTGSNCSFFGMECGHGYSTQNNNDAFGFRSQYTATSGTGNASFGAQSLTLMNGASFVTAMGVNAAQNLTTGGSNIFIGYGVAPTPLTSSSCIIIGVNSDVADALTNVIGIGNTVQITTSNTATIGNSSMTALIFPGTNLQIQNANAALNFGVANDCQLLRDGVADTFAFKRGANNQTVRFYGDATHYGYITCIAQNMYIDGSGMNNILIGGNVTSILPNGSGTVSLGTAGFEFKNITLKAGNIITDTTTGTKIGTATTQKFGFWNATPVVQPSTTGQTTGYTAGASTAVTIDGTFTGGVGATAYTLGDVVKALKNTGIMAQ